MEYFASETIVTKNVFDESQMSSSFIIEYHKNAQNDKHQGAIVKKKRVCFRLYLSESNCVKDFTIHLPVSLPISMIEYVAFGGSTLGNYLEDQDEGLFETLTYDQLQIYGIQETCDEQYISIKLSFFTTRLNKYFYFKYNSLLINSFVIQFKTSVPNINEIKLDVQAGYLQYEIEKTLYNKHFITLVTDIEFMYLRQVTLSKMTSSCYEFNFQKDYVYWCYGFIVSIKPKDGSIFDNTKVNHISIVTPFNTYMLQPFQSYFVYKFEHTFDMNQISKYNLVVKLNECNDELAHCDVSLNLCCKCIIRTTHGAICMFK